MITNYHAKLYAHELLQRHPSDNIERFTATLMDSEVDLNPHQIDAALFAFRSPFSKGAILADEVGLGKTIEAGIVLSQKWAERKRKILIIVPSSLRKQWHQELQDKFYLPSTIIESKNFNKAIKDGKSNPFELKESIAIASYPFTRNKSDFVRLVNWDLIVIDEAHRLRNVYKTSNKIAKELKSALEHAPKLLLTATPLQNSLLELYGLVSFVDEHAFGDLKSFRTQFARPNEDSFIDLKERLKPICKRTLRKQVLEYISYTKRQAHTEEFIPTEDEQTLYELVSDYLRKPDLQALPSSQRSLMTLVLRKLLASSTFAIAGALDTMKRRLQQRLEDSTLKQVNVEDYDEIATDFEIFDDIEDEYSDDNEQEILTELEREAIEREIEELTAFAELAMQITNNAKGEALLKALEHSFEITHQLGSAEKAIIFTESRKTQNYLVELLTKNGYEDQIVLFNGSNTDVKSRAIYADWKEQFKDTDKFTGSRTADTRAALVDYFRNSAKIMIATEAAAEGINLQFCSLVVNYDLPWNPQRIEQRIGRCHRYGQKHDVVVVNFLNKNNAADQRVYELLSEKFQLFNGVFGASDEVLGSIESGIDFEKRIVDIYQKCRTTEEIQASFDLLQEEFGEEIDESMRNTRQKLLENFDNEVAEKLNIYSTEAKTSLNKYENLLWEVSKHELIDYASFDDEELSFVLNQAPSEDTLLGRYTLKRRDEVSHHYRIQHNLAQWTLSKASGRNLESKELVFNYSDTPIKITELELFIGSHGTLTVTKLTVESVDSEDYIVLTAVTHDNKRIARELTRRLFNLPAIITEGNTSQVIDTSKVYKRYKNQIIGDISERNASFYEEEMDKLDRWAEDKRKSLKANLSDYDEETKALKKEERLAPNMPDKLKIRRKLRNIEKKRDEAWREYDESAKLIEEQKDTLIDKVEAQLKQSIVETELFTINWKLI